ncbi:MAG: hypothetical protein AAFX01_07845 [Cyanobacteria bacterium J06638_28]
MASPAPESAPHGRSAWQDAEPLGVYQPLTSRLATGNLASQLNFIQPLGSRSLSVLQPKALIPEQGSVVENLGQPFEDFPFFEAPQLPETPRASQPGMAEPAVMRSPQQPTSQTSPPPVATVRSPAAPNLALPTPSPQPPAHPGSASVPSAVEAELPSTAPIQRATADSPIQRSDDSAQPTSPAPIPGTAHPALSQPNPPPSSTPPVDRPKQSRGSTSATDAARSDMPPIEDSSSSSAQGLATSPALEMVVDETAPLQNGVQSTNEDAIVASPVSEHASVADPVQAQPEEAAAFSTASAEVVQRQTAPTPPASSLHSPVIEIAAAETSPTTAPNPPVSPVVDETASVESGSDTVLAREGATGAIPHEPNPDAAAWSPSQPPLGEPVVQRQSSTIGDGGVVAAEATTPSIASPSSSMPSERGDSASTTPSSSDSAAPDWVQREPIASSPAAPDLPETSTVAADSTEPDTTVTAPKSDASTTADRQTPSPQPPVPDDAGLPSLQRQISTDSDDTASGTERSRQAPSATESGVTPPAIESATADTVPVQRQTDVVADIAATLPETVSQPSPRGTDAGGEDTGDRPVSDTETPIQAGAMQSASEQADVLALPDITPPSGIPSPESATGDTSAIQRQAQISGTSPIEQPEAPQSSAPDIASVLSDDAVPEASTNPAIAAIDSITDAATAIQQPLPSSEGTDLASSPAIAPATTARTSLPSLADDSGTPLATEPPLSEAPTPSATVTPNLSPATEAIPRSPATPTPDVPADSFVNTADVEPSAASPAAEAIPRSPTTTASSAPTELVANTPGVEPIAGVDATAPSAGEAIQRSLTANVSATSVNAEPDTAELSDAIPPHPGTTLPDSVSSTLPAIDTAVQRSPDALTVSPTPSGPESPLVSGQTDRISIDESSTSEPSISRDVTSEVSDDSANLSASDVELPSEINAQSSTSVVNATSVEPVVQRRQSEPTTPEPESITPKATPAVQKDPESGAVTDTPLPIVQASPDEVPQQASQPVSPAPDTSGTSLAASAGTGESSQVADALFNIPTSEPAAPATSSDSDATSLAPIQPLMDADTERPFLSPNQAIQRSLALPQVVQDLGTHTPLRSPQALNPMSSAADQSPPEASLPQPASMPVNQTPERSSVSSMDLLTTNSPPSASEVGEVSGSGAAEQLPIQRRVEESAPTAPAASSDAVDAPEEPSNQLPTQSWDSVAALLAQFPTVSADASPDSTPPSQAAAQEKFAPQLKERSVVPASTAQDSFSDLHAADTPAPPIQRSPVSRSMPSVSPTVIQRFATDDANVGEEQDRQEVSGEAASSGGTSPEALDQLAQVMYQMVRQRLLIERERLGRSGSGRFQ